MEQKIFCYNCGNYGHIFRNCHYPIISLGIICFCKIKEEYNFILVRRKDTLGYTDFIRGKYNMEKDNILDLINIMTNEEKENLINNDLKILWDKLWTINKDEHLNEFEKSNYKFELLKKEGINSLKLEDLIKISNTNYLEPEWGFPKGKREKNENNLECAKREFQEETNLNNNEYKLLNLNPVIENYIGSNKKKYRHIYYIAELLINDNLSVSKENIFQQTEISSIKLMNYKNIRKKIRPYNSEKIKVIESIIESLNYCNEHNIKL